MLYPELSLNWIAKKQSWYYNSDFEKWFFEKPPNIPASMFRWGGITQLLGGPKNSKSN